MEGKEIGAESADGWVVVVNGIGDSVVEEELMDKFSEFGEVKSIVFPISKRSAQSYGYAFIQFVEKKGAKGAVEEGNGSSLKGSNIVVDFAFKEPPYRSYSSSQYNYKN